MSLVDKQPKGEQCPVRRLDGRGGGWGLRSPVERRLQFREGLVNKWLFKISSEDI
jgi:hypothetical protein